ncbi:uncharacterized protein LOC109725739 isoform X1 [Ananas comosus]|uniref:Uncharacterized protein LOC109725739 isoform X1 n=2 Tax=Ananas comosus TaxID=4615 RepID=A0A6P5GXX6_ANACO|nr:uncharacterized protein LOC109725739 isoform X1 [Ananas comosus]XP_020110654.1 uncharacterized protein LOC109725739 isoform X1 [Ananas comosus]XP_020110655.1 uncharacterized protein LOC109725739 isoform X1 [Ananas comosus]XP_020110656.1 uncharacterized protein LOC109725739 isoform X1 [Ananas comosus]XP_020110657.1 uncharacterized protein LOC109725739 isoform X1 [Ananas comosus]XP_020110658.1 uncharacterized protein LOC109725739 isoform X1 [Ananas comosus]
MHQKITSALVYHRKFLLTSPRHFRAAVDHHTEEILDVLPPEWYRAGYARLFRLTQKLRNVELIDGRLMNTCDGSIITDDHIMTQMNAFNSLAKAFFRSPPSRHHSNKNGTACFQKPCKRDSVTINSLTKVCDLLNISAQQRSTVRVTLCPQVTQHHIWRGALEQVLKDLKYEMDSRNIKSPTFQMGAQIVSTCIQFFDGTNDVSASDSPLWMRPAPMKKVEKLQPSRKWEEVVEMFVDLSKCLAKEERLAYHVSKIEAMKEGLYQIKDILTEKDITYKEARRQDCLVQKKLSKSLGHSSKCLFTLLLYYLYGSVRDIEVEVCGPLRGGGDKFSMCVGKTLTWDDERIVLNGVRQLSRALGVLKFVWETARVNAALELHGHLWCLDARERTITYRGHVYNVHGLWL